MKTLAEQDLNDNEFARQVATMIETGLITSLFYKPWTLEILATTPTPPDWIRDLSTIDDSTKAVEMIRSYLFAYSQTIDLHPDEDIELPVDIEEHIACLYLKCKRRELSLATFLEQAALATNSEYGELGEFSSRYFYEILDEVRMNLFSKRGDIYLHTRIEADFYIPIEWMEPLYQGFEQYFRANHKVKE